jgi:hypothetical protein
MAFLIVAVLTFPRSISDSAPDDNACKASANMSKFEQKAKRDAAFRQNFDS